MRITRLKLENFIGIKHGLDRDVIEIVFPKDDNRIVMLLGGNGSGKSTIMEQLNPFKEGVSERKDLIIDGKIGRKEIDIETDSGDKYEIVHIYSKNAQSFIKKNGEELNENGSVRLFEDKLRQELKITKDYSRIGNIGSNTRSFVDFVRAERKNYIGTFLNIKDILEKYETANDKLKQLKKERDAIANDLKKFKSKESIETEMTQITELLNTLSEELKKLYSEKGATDAHLDNAVKNIGSDSITALATRIKEKENDILLNTGIIDSLKGQIIETKDIKLVEAQRDVIQEEINKLLIDISVNNTDLSNKNLVKLEYKNNISKTESALSSLGDPESIQKISDEIAEVSNEMDIIKTRIKANPVSLTVKVLKENKIDVQRNLEKLRNLADFIEKYFVELQRTSFEPGTTNIELFFDDEFGSKFESQIHETRALLQSQNTLLESHQKDRGVKEGHVCQLKNLEKRPSACNIDDCPFIKEAYKNRNVLNEICEIDGKITETKNDISRITVKLENLQELQRLYLSFQNVYNAVDVRNNQLYTLLIKDKSLVDWIKGSLSEFKLFREDLIESIESADFDFDLFMEKRRHLNSLKEGKSRLEDTDLAVREKYLADIEENKTKMDAVDLEIENLKKISEKLTEELQNKRSSLEAYNKFIQANSKNESAKVMLSTAKARFDAVVKSEEERTSLESKKKDIDLKILEYERLTRDKNQDLDKLKHNLNQVIDLGTKYAKLKETYTPVEAVTKALSPSSGIPVILMQTYLRTTEDIANELLSIAFGEDFRIKFVTNEKEFSIQVISKENLKPDIKLASQGEIAITTISISLALIEQSIGEYNILCLDEIDGPLDINNRGKFIDILNSQIGKLGIEQVFVISHNDAFDTAAMDLILLKGNSVNKDNANFMENKNIIFDVDASEE